MNTRMYSALLLGVALGFGTATCASAVDDDQFITEQESSQVPASSIMGMAIKNSVDKNAEVIGKVSDLIMDEDLKLIGIVVGVGGFLGIGEKHVGISWDSVDDINVEDDTAVVVLSKKELEEAPAFKNDQDQQAKEGRGIQQQQQTPGMGGHADGTDSAPAAGQD